MQHTVVNIIDVLIGHARCIPQQTAFIWLKDGETAAEQWSFAELLAKVEKLAVVLASKQLQGKRALLVYSDVLDFTTAFLACQYAGVVAVPVYFAGNKRYQAKLLGIMDDAKVGAVLTLATHKKAMEPALNSYWQQHNVVIVDTDVDIVALQEATPVQPVDPNGIAFIQYTSGSTGKPKGVVITHGNLLHNQQLIQHTFGCNQQSVILTWLPFHHDMGLIGNILHGIYVGCTCVVMSPFHFVQQPLRWLKAIGRYGVTHSGGPNFAYDHCVSKIPTSVLSQLDLSSWKVAFNGAEPVRATSLQQFADYFKPAGFSATAFYPCYGLAEATLLVSGCKSVTAAPQIVYVKEGVDTTQSLMLADEKEIGAKAVVSSGALPPGMTVKIVQANGRSCGELETGEICIGGDSITSGYWNKDNSDVFCHIGNEQLLKTGDTGFMYNNQLFVYGRLKEMIIIRGENFYPYDIEYLVAESVDAVETNGVAAFGINAPEEALVLVAEIKRSYLQSVDATAIIQRIEQEVTATFGIVPYDIVLTTPLGLPRTTSGKIQRLQCRTQYVEKAFTVVGSKLDDDIIVTAQVVDTATLLEAVKTNPDYDNIKTYLAALVLAKTGHRVNDEQQDLNTLGIDSLRAMELMNTINNELNINMDVTAIFEHHTTAALAGAIEHLLWLKSSGTIGVGEIEI